MISTDNRSKVTRIKKRSGNGDLSEISRTRFEYPTVEERGKPLNFLQVKLELDNIYHAFYWKNNFIFDKMKIYQKN